jgi:hypothetical protein
MEALPELAQFPVELRVPEGFTSFEEDEIYRQALAVKRVLNPLTLCGVDFGLLFGAKEFLQRYVVRGVQGVPDQLRD